MALSPANYRVRVVWELFGRLTLTGSAAGLASVALYVLSEIDAWIRYQSIAETAIQIAQLTLVALAAAAIGAALVTGFTVAMPPWGTEALMRRSRSVVRLVNVAALIFCSLVFWRTLFFWTAAVKLFSFPFLPKYSLWLALVATSLIWVRLRRPRQAGKIGPELTGNLTRRLVIGSGLGAAGVVLASAALRSSTAVRVATATRSTRPPNVILVTFDALSADDMSLYGYHLPTTPNMDAFAKSASVFKNFFCCSTWTTPCVASIQTGRYPTNTRVFQSLGHLQGQSAQMSLVREMRAAGYHTGASVSNINAYPPRLGLEFDIVPQPPIAGLIAPPLLLDDALSIQMRVRDILEAELPSTFGSPNSRFRPELSFQQAGKLLASLTPPFFLWVHVMAPHYPYKPSPAFLNRFLGRDQHLDPSDISRFLNPASLRELANGPGRQYGPQDQPFVDKWRLRYDEWIADADNAFGRFVSELERTESSRNSVIMVSSDHGESFEGGVWAHGGPNFVRQLVHVPFIVREPGQTEGRSVSGAADQTAIAPTILDLAGLAVPDWMDGKSAKSWLSAERDDGSMGVAFTQFIDESNSVFSPVRSGTVGAIADGHQYVLNIASGNGALYRLAEANLQDNDISRMNPELAASMRALILSRFPEILRGAA